MGGHVDACTGCCQVRVSYNSCRNRHCPKCQGRKREQWIQAREQELLPVPYFHVVFTLPDTLNQLALHQPRLVYDTLFEAAWATLLAFATDGTWGQGPAWWPCSTPGARPSRCTPTCTASCPAGDSQ
ncbi:transposase zinc-binding domain-containing protein [Pontibacter korlensis]|uniref:IS91 family transposase n=1 Tax=Pontibacter korlensis TaxID=400092 RepID=UPI0039EE9D57